MAGRSLLLHIAVRPCIALIKDYFENKPLQKQLVAAYIVGMTIHRILFILKNV
jgi:hypothetical protein